MKTLFVSDREEKRIWNHWESNGRRLLGDVRLILSAGDIKAEYLEFLVTMLNVPCLYVRGNHDSFYDTRPPEGCVNIDGKIAELAIDDRTIRIAGLGGSMRYREGPDMFTEKEMRRRVRRLIRQAGFGMVCGPGGRSCHSSDLARCVRRGDCRPIDVFLTHAPCFGHGDMEDLPHRGFECFNDFNEKLRPDYHCYGHVHAEYDPMMQSESEHPSGTHLINVNGMYILDL